ncbi:hypothetical protein [Pseudonocardia alni]|uniref:hypothetical protein n=1 Tax=Pseudonocardia alni TaxID=33907 RepID=UPI00279BA4F8|nr:hypothetical protein PaSha_12770 [Pseudonocardia alni]
MAEYLLMVDLAGIQSFVFRSRRLLDAVGRAAQVEDLTDGQRLRDSGVLSEHDSVMSRGAGTLVLSSTTDARRRALAARYTRLASDVSAALNPILGIPDVDPTHDRAAALRAAPDVMRRARHRHRPPIPAVTPLGGLRCAHTDAPATDVVDGVAVAADFRDARRRGRRWHRTRQETLLRDAPLPASEAGWALPTMIDQLGRTAGDSSQIAVLVADLNDLGDTLARLADTDAGLLPHAANLLRRLTDELAEAVVHRVAAAVEHRDDGSMWVCGEPAELRFPLHRLTAEESVEDPADTGAHLLPVRPWVIAGDDLVLLCDARLAWSIADEIVTWLDDTAADGTRRELRGLPGFEESELRRPLTAGIGIAVVPVGYSLRHAHDLAARLCRHAKQRRTDMGRTGHVIDWHRGAVDAASALAARNADGELPVARPLVHDRVDDTGSTSWKSLLDGLDPRSPTGMRTPGPGTWPTGWLRGELPHLLRRGPAATREGIADRRDRTTTLTGTPPPELLTGEASRRLGADHWGSTPPPLADALDLMGTHLVLGRREEQR